MAAWIQVFDVTRSSHRMIDIYNDKPEKEIKATLKPIQQNAKKFIEN